MYPITPNVCCRTICGKLKFKFATSCAPGRRLVDLSWYPSASRSLASQTSSLSIQEWISTAVITATCCCHSSCCPWCVTCQAISSSFYKTAHPHTGHVKNVRFLEQSTPAFIPADPWPPNGTDLNPVDYKTGWHPAASASVAATQHWRTEEAFLGRLARHGPQRYWQCNWRIA